ncbi:3-ketosteroid-9-alpha-hydroxylase, partial [Nocardioides sp. Bht2]
REIVDNVVDMAHFFYIHYAFPHHFRNVFEGQSAYQYMNGTGREDIRARSTRPGPVSLGSTSVAAYHGPSFMIDELTYHYEDGDTETILINCHYPIDENSFVLMYGVIVEQKEGVTAEEAEVMAAKTAKFIKYGFEQDVAIWNSKAPIDNPLLCEEDGPVYQLRRWYQQFYVDVEDVTPEMTERFEFEIDTTRPNEAWRAEVEANLAARAGSGD